MFYSGKFTLDQKILYALHRFEVLELESKRCRRIKVSRRHLLLYDFRQ